MAEMLQAAIDLIKAGDRQGGRRLLAEIVAGDPRNEHAWLWLAGVVDTDEQRLYCVRQVLKLNPANQAALTSLASLEPGARPAGQAALTSPAAPERHPPPPSPPPAAPPAAAVPLDAAQQAELTELIVRELGKQASRQDLILGICERTGLSWPQAEALVRKVEAGHEERIRRKRAPLLVVVALATIVIGAATALPNLAYFITFFGGPSPDLALLPFMWRRIFVLVVGLALGAGGILGLIRIAVPPAGGLEAEAEANRALEGSIDDVVSVRVGVGRPRRRRR